MSIEQVPIETAGQVLPPGSVLGDHAVWRLVFRLVDVGCRGEGWHAYARITLWVMLTVTAVTVFVAVAGPWWGLGWGGALGGTRLLRAARRRAGR